MSNKVCIAAKLCKHEGRNSESWALVGIFTSLQKAIECAKAYKDNDIFIYGYFELDKCYDFDSPEDVQLDFSISLVALPDDGD